MSTLKRYNGSSWETIGGSITGDTLPIGSEVDYDGSTVPAGWEQVSDIIESGSNANGSYIKFNNGTMICYATIPFTMDITGQFESIYYANSGEITFPQEFYAIPVINVTLRGVAGGGYSFYTPTTTGFDGFVWKIQSKSNVDLYVMYSAIGRWK